MRKLFVILGVPIDDLNRQEALHLIEEMVEAGRANRKRHHVATVNTDFVVNALRDAELRTILQNADLSTADGMPLVWGARVLGIPLQERVTGSDLVPALAERAAQCGYSLYLLGGAPGVAAEAAGKLRARFPGLKIAGVCSPPFGPLQDLGGPVVEAIRKAKPDILLVAFGNPKQEKWIQRYGPAVNVPVMMGVGGSLDFIAGKTRRAPSWMQAVGLEWLYRLIQEPARLWRRYAVDLFVFSSLFTRQWLVMRKHFRPLIGLPPDEELLLLGDVAVARLRGQLTLNERIHFQKLGRAAMSKAKSVVIDMKSVEFVDSSGIGSLVEITRQARITGGQAYLVAVQPQVLNVFSLLRIDSFFVIKPDLAACLAEHFA